MSTQNKTIQWGKTHQNGSRKGARPARNGRKGVSAEQARLDKLATLLKGFIGSENFVSVRDNGVTILFRENGTVIAKADSSQDFDKVEEAAIDVVLEDKSELAVPLAVMAQQQKSVSHLDKGVRRKCWLVRTTNDNGRTTYRPEGVAYVDGMAMPLRESAARRAIAAQLAWGMTPKSAGKDGKRVKFDIRSKDGKGTRYAFRFNGTDIAEFYHDGRLEAIGEGAMPIEKCLNKAEILCVDDSRLMAKVASCLLSPDVKSEADRITRLYDDFKNHEHDDAYDGDEAYFAGVTETAVERGWIRKGQHIADFGIYFAKDKKTGEYNFALFAAPSRRETANRQKIAEPEHDFGGDEPSEDEACPFIGQQAGRHSQSATVVAAAQVAVVAPVAA